MARTRKKPELPLEALRIESTPSAQVLHLEGSVGVAQARKVHDLALQLAQTGKAVEVRAEHLRHVDCAAVQVLSALHETLRSQGTPWTVANLPDSVKDTLNTAGFTAEFAPIGAGD